MTRRGHLNQTIRLRGRPNHNENNTQRGATKEEAAKTMGDDEGTKKGLEDNVAGVGYAKKGRETAAKKQADKGTPKVTTVIGTRRESRRHAGMSKRRRPSPNAGRRRDAASNTKPSTSVRPVVTRSSHFGRRI